MNITSRGWTVRLGGTLEAVGADRRTALLLLGVVVVATSAFAMRYYDGQDFVYNVWAPIRGLLAGHNPYDPSDAEYFGQYQVPVVAGLYAPTALLVHAPLALLSQSRSADAMAVLNAALIWLGVLLLIPPRTAHSYFGAAAAGALVVLSAPAEITIKLGQLSGLAFAGLALLVASLRKDPSATWLPAIGATFVALKPQSMIPIFIALGVLGCRKVLLRAATILAVTSLPGAVLFIRAAGNPMAILRTIGENLDLLSRLPPGDLANPRNLRIDALGLVSHLGGPALIGLGWNLVILLVTTGLLVLAVRACDQDARTLADPYVATLVTLYVVASLYHLTYDQLLFYVGPLAAFGILTESNAGSRSSRVIASGGVALIGAGLVLRSGFCARMVHYGLPSLTVHKAWVTSPMLIVVALVGCAFALGRRPNSRAGELHRQNRRDEIEG